MWYSGSKQIIKKCVNNRGYSVDRIASSFLDCTYGVASGGVLNASGMHKVGDVEVSCMVRVCGKVWGVVRV